MVYFAKKLEPSGLLGYSFLEVFVCVNAKVLDWYLMTKKTESKFLSFHSILL